MIELIYGKKGYFHILSNGIIQKQSFFLKVMGWRVKVSRLVVPHFLNLLKKKRFGFLGWVSFTLFSFFGVFFPLIIFLYLAENNRYGIEWIDNGKDCKLLGEFRGTGL